MQTRSFVYFSRVLVVASMLASLPLRTLAAPAPVPAPWTFDALRALVSVRSPEISPDGTRVAYVRSTRDFVGNRDATELAIVDVRGGAARTLVGDRDGIASPKWSPSGDRIAYLASPERGKPAQLYVLPIGGGDSRKLTDRKGGVTSFAWRPDGAAFAFAAKDESAKTMPEGYEPAFAVTDEHFLVREPSRPTHLFTIAADGTVAKQLTHDAASVPSEGTAIVWTPDANALLVTLAPDAVFAHFDRARVARVDATSGIATMLSIEGPNSNPVLSHDGKSVAVALPRHGSVYLQNDESIRDLATGAEVASSRAIDRNVHWFGWAPDDRAFYVAGNDGVRAALWRMPIGGAPTRVDLGDLDFAPGASLARDGTLAFVGLRPDAPAEIYALAAGTAAPRKLTDENAFARGYRTARRERFDWTSDDGLAIAGVLTYPLDFTPGKTYPLVLDIHGGPVSTSLRNFNGLEAELDEVLAARGYFVLQPNYRGSDNSGDAFLSAIVPHVTSAPGRDNLAGVAALVKRGFIDEKRIGVSGWSGGGLQTSWLVGHASFWKAAVSGAAVNDWYEQAVLADINEDFARDFLGGANASTPAGRAAMLAESPIATVDAIHTPLLILSDTGDQRVPITQAFELYHALHDRGRTVRFVAFPRAGHFPTDPVGRESVLKLWSGWFDRWMK